MTNFVSRAGEKLDFALEHFKINIKDKICADFGSSTGGFVDCLLQHGATKVYSVETAYGQLEWKLRNDERVKVMERTNAMHVELPEKVDFISIDVSWTKQENIIENALNNLKKNGLIISLVKPHYEAGKKDLRKGRLEQDKVSKVVEEVKQKINDLGKHQGAFVKEIVESPIVGKKGGNKEYLFLIKKS